MNGVTDRQQVSEAGRAVWCLEESSHDQQLSEALCPLRRHEKPRDDNDNNSNVWHIHVCTFYVSKIWSYNFIYSLKRSTFYFILCRTHNQPIMLIGNFALFFFFDFFFCYDLAKNNVVLFFKCKSTVLRSVKFSLGHESVHRYAL